MRRVFWLVPLKEACGPGYSMGVLLSRFLRRKGMGGMPCLSSCIFSVYGTLPRTDAGRDQSDGRVPRPRPLAHCQSGNASPQCCHGSSKLSLQYLFYVTVNIYFYFLLHIAGDIITGLFIFVDIRHFNHTFSHAHIEAHSHTHTCMIQASAQEESREPGTALEPGWEGRKKVLLETKA